MAGLEQIKEGKTKDFYTVCDRLEKKHRGGQYQIRITELAEEELENAGDYIACKLKNPFAAENTVSLNFLNF